MLAKIKLIIELLPLIIQLIKHIETAIPGKGKGEAKLVFVREALEAVADAADDITQNWGWINSVITSLVKAFNLTDAFKEVAKDGK